MEISLKGRSALVTGGSKGLGFAVANRFAASGADVAILGRGKEALDAAVAQIKTTAKGKVIGVQCDVSKAGEITRAFGEVMSGLGKVDIVVNNAGATRAGPFEKLTDEILQADLAGEGAPFNVLVNALLVGFINSDQHVQLAKKLGVPTEEFVAGRAKDIPMGRAGEAEEFANIACFLASDAASYIAGVGINVDGGHSPLW